MKPIYECNKCHFTFIENLENHHDMKIPEWYRNEYCTGGKEPVIGERKERMKKVIQYLAQHDADPSIQYESIQAERDIEKYRSNLKSLHDFFSLQATPKKISWFDRLLGKEDRDYFAVIIARRIGEMLK